jgi:hypothetical protein
MDLFKALLTLLGGVAFAAMVVGVLFLAAFF